MDVSRLPIDGLIVIQPNILGDARGYFLESYNATRYAECGVEAEFVQDNFSFSEKGVLRGLHFQNPHSQGKLVSVIHGTVYDVAVDIRKGSPTFGESYGIELNGEEKKQFYIPPGFAHGFCVLSDTALFHYKCTDVYHPEAERCLLWNDPSLMIDWPISSPQLSGKDLEGQRLEDLSEDTLLEYRGA